MSKWRKYKIGQCCEILDNLRIPINDSERQLIPGNIPYYGATGIQGYINKFLFDENLILLAEDGGNFEQFNEKPIAYRITGKSWINNHAHILKAKIGFDQNFIFYSIVNKNILTYIKGGTRSKLNQKDLKEIDIIAPEFLEQQNIAFILNTFDSVIESTEQTIDKLNVIKQGMMQDLFMRGLDEKGKLRPGYDEAPELYREVKLGWVPKEWDVKSLIQTTYIKGRIGWQGLKASEFIDKGPYLITGTDFQDGEINWDSCYHISEFRFNEDPKIHIKNNDVLITKDGSIGKTAFVENCPEKAILNSGIFVLRNKDGLFINKYLFLILNSFYFDNFLKNYQGGSTISHLYQREFEKFLFPIPPIDEQKKIIDRVEAISQKLTSEVNYLYKTKRIKQGLMQDLLSGKKRVNIWTSEKIENLESQSK